MQLRMKEPTEPICDDARVAVDDAPPALPAEIPAAAERYETRNFLVLAAYQVAMRAGWIFKTESIVMPFVLDSLGGAGWLRGMLPLINRFGQSIPPLLAARRVTVWPQKKWLLLGSSSLMAASFLALAALWALAPGPHKWMAAAFLTIYTLFFVCTGINQLVLNTLQGKLIEATHRGRLMLVANLVGAVVAIGLVLWLLPRWLRADGADFVWIFLFTGLCFGLTAASSLLLVEASDAHQQAPLRVRQVFAAAGRTLRNDPNFLRLALVAAAFSSTMMLFPQYQALGLGPRVGLDATHLIWWIILQNVGTGLFSLIAGPLADARGNRLVLQVLLLALCLAPPAALLIAHFGTAAAESYSCVFLLIGLTPVTVRVLNNYTLEVAPPADQPRYLSTLSVCMAAPIPLSPLVGWWIDLAGFEPVFLAITGLLLAGWLLTFTLREPRHKGALP